MKPFLDPSCAAGNAIAMRFAIPLAAVFLFAAVVSPAFAGITFGPVRGQPGESVRLVTHSETHGGTISTQTPLSPATPSRWRCRC